eukprot:1102722-Pelagomonas_calceolata.AAC.5
MPRLIRHVPRNSTPTTLVIEKAVRTATTRKFVWCQSRDSYAGSILRTSNFRPPLIFIHLLIRQYLKTHRCSRSNINVASIVLVTLKLNPHLQSPC